MNYEDFKNEKFAFEHDGTVEQLREATKDKKLMGFGRYYYYRYGFLDFSEEKPDLPTIKVTEYMNQSDYTCFGSNHNTTFKETEYLDKSEYPKTMICWNNDEAFAEKLEIFGMFKGQYVTKKTFGTFITYKNAKEIEPEIEVDTLVYVRNCEGFEWSMRRFSHFENGVINCFRSQKTSKETSNTNRWSFYSITNPLI